MSAKPGDVAAGCTGGSVVAAAKPAAQATIFSSACDKADAVRFMADLRLRPSPTIRPNATSPMIKAKMKISGGFRTPRAGAETFATLRTVILTACKQGWNILQTLAAPAIISIADQSG